MRSELDVGSSRAQTISAVTKVAGKRMKIAFGLSGFLLIINVGYVYLMMASEAISNATVYGSINLFSFASILTCILGVMVAGFYTWWANTKLDPEMDKLREQYNAE
jgi:uncharacterized membrane protein (DUF485 family)